MSGNLMDMMGKLQSLQQNFNDLKDRLDAEVFTETSSDGKLSVTMTELATIRDIKIDESLYSDPEQLEDQLVVTLNKALEKVKTNAVKEAKETAKSSLPPIPGLGL